MSVPFHKIQGNREEQLEKLDKSKAVLKKVSVVLENEETMDELIQVEMHEVNDYINIRYAILALKDLIQKMKKRNHEDIQLRDKARTFIKKYTMFEDEDLTLNVENLQRILKELE